MTRDTDTAAVLTRLYETILARKGADAGTSYTASLFAGGADLICAKVEEETLETTIEGRKGDGAALTRESADLLYHLLVLWANTGIAPEDVWAELSRREGTSGIAEKASRPKKD